MNNRYSNDDNGILIENHLNNNVQNENSEDNLTSNSIHNVSDSTNSIMNKIELPENKFSDLSLSNSDCNNYNKKYKDKKKEQLSDNNSSKNINKYIDFCDENSMNKKSINFPNIDGPYIEMSNKNSLNNSNNIIDNGILRKISVNDSELANESSPKIKYKDGSYEIILGNGNFNLFNKHLENKNNNIKRLEMENYSLKLEIKDLKEENEAIKKDNNFNLEAFQGRKLLTLKNENKKLKNFINEKNIKIKNISNDKSFLNEFNSILKNNMIKNKPNKNAPSESYFTEIKFNKELDKYKLIIENKLKIIDDLNLEKKNLKLVNKELNKKINLIENNSNNLKIKLNKEMIKLNKKDELIDNLYKKKDMENKQSMTNYENYSKNTQTDNSYIYIHIKFLKEINLGNIDKNLLVYYQNNIENLNIDDFKLYENILYIYNKSIKNLLNNDIINLKLKEIVELKRKWNIYKKKGQEIDTISCNNEVIRANKSIQTKEVNLKLDEYKKEIKNLNNIITKIKIENFNTEEFKKKYEEKIRNLDNKLKKEQDFNKVKDKKNLELFKELKDLRESKNEDIKKIKLKKKLINSNKNSLNLKNKKLNNLDKILYDNENKYINLKRELKNMKNIIENSKKHKFLNEELSRQNTILYDRLAKSDEYIKKILTENNNNSIIPELLSNEETKSIFFLLLSKLISSEKFINEIKNNESYKKLIIMVN